MAERKSFIKLGMIYAVGQILSKALSFVLLPIYTRQLGSNGYGQLALADTVLDFVSAFIICGINSGYNRFYREYDKDQKNILKSTVINFALIIAFFSMIFAIIFGKSVSNIIFKFNNSYEVIILVILRSITVQFVALLMCDYTLNYRATFSVLVNIIILILNIGFSLLFIIYKKQGIIGVYKSYIYSNAIILVYLLAISLRSYKPVIDKEMLKKMLKFSGGYIPASIASTILTLSDRYFLANYKNYSDTGIYSIGYKFGMLIEPLFVLPFKYIFAPYKFQVWRDRDAQEKLNNMFIKYHFIGCFFILLISFYCKSIIIIFTSKEYLLAYKLVPIIALSYFLYEMNSFYSLGIEIKNKTYLESYILIFGGIVNIILNILLIPRYSMYGATISTIISYIFMNIIYIFYAMPMYYIRYDFKAVFKFYIIVVVLYLLYYIVSVIDINLFFECIISFLLLITYIILCVALNLIKKEEVISYYDRIKVKLGTISG